MPSIINATTTNGVAVSGDTSGALALQTNNGTTALTIDTAQNVSTVKDVTINGVTVGKGAGSGSNNVAVGLGALQANTTASNNTAVGYQAGYSNTTGTISTFVGYLAGQNATGTNNTFIGAAAGLNSSGNGNTFIGSVAANGSGALMTSGSKNTIIGAYSGNQNGLDIRTANNYIVLSDGDGNPRGYFNNAGTFFVGYTGTGGFQMFPDYGATGSSGMIIGHSTSAGASDIYITFQYNGGGIGSITQNGTTGVLYNTTSDYRLKENQAPLTGAKDFILALQPKTWTWKQDGSKGTGFIAHEAQLVAKESVTGEKDAVDEDGNPIYQSMQAGSSEIIANLVAFVQEQQAIIESLKTRIEVLENK